MNFKQILLVSIAFGCVLGCSKENKDFGDLEKETQKDVFYERNRLDSQNISFSSKTRPISDVQKKERRIIELCHGAMQCVCDSIPDMLSYQFDGKTIRCRRNIR